MEINNILLVALFLVLLGDDYSYGADLEVKATTNTGFDPKNPLNSNKKNSSDEEMGGSKPGLDSTIKVDQVKTDENQVGKLKEGVSLNESNSNRQPELKEVHDVQINKGNSTEKGGRKGKSEECDSSNKCTVEKNKLVACLRVPGNESPDLSLLIQNKGKGPLTITISAPDFVRLEKTSIQLQAKENGKVKVSIGNGGTGNLTIFTAGHGSCSLNFRDLIGHNSREESDHTQKLSYISFLTCTPSIALVSFAALLIMASTWMCVVSFRRKHFLSNRSKYQKLGKVLPVSGGGKADLDINDGWDNSWGDSWDDEEAPKTPSMPVTPSLSSKGLATRRFSKEGWKD